MQPHGPRPDPIQESVHNLRIIRETALPYLWPQQREKLKVLPATLGELSQAIGAALVALYTSKKVN